MNGNGASLTSIVSTKERHIWPNRSQFYMSILSFAIGLGNFWRLPPLVMRNGGGAFLIPYVIMICVLCGPLFFIELAVGQKYRTGSIGVWQSIHPALGGVGIAATIVCYLVAVYYNGITAYVIYYLYRSISIELPWVDCPLNSPSRNECMKSDSVPQYFFNRVALDTTNSLSELGSFKLQIFVCLLLAWIVVYLSVRRGVKTSGYVMYVTCMFPYVTLIVFLAHAMSLDGAWDGLKILMKPDLSKVFDPNVWLLAATQGFFNFGIAFGGLIAYGSYNPENHNFQGDCVKLTGANLATSILTVIWVFLIEGHHANHRFFECYREILDARQVPDIEFEVEKLQSTILSQGSMDGVSIIHNQIHCGYNDFLWNTTQGAGLAFVVFTEAITLFPVNNVSCVVFYLMLLTLGLGSMFGTLEGVITCAADAQLLGLKKPVLTLMLCGFACLLGLAFFSFGNGQYVITLLDSFCSTYALLIVAFFEIFSIVVVVGTDRFCQSLEEMTGSRPSYFFYFCWKYVDPILMFFIFFAFVSEYFFKQPTYMAYDQITTRQNETTYPWWGLCLAILIITLTILPIPLVALHHTIDKWRKAGQIEEKDIEQTLDLINTTSTDKLIREHGDHNGNNKSKNNSKRTTSLGGYDPMTPTEEDKKIDSPELPSPESPDTNELYPTAPFGYDEDDRNLEE